MELEDISDKFMKHIQQIVAMCLGQKDAGTFSGEAVHILVIALDYFSLLTRSWGAFTNQGVQSLDCQEQGCSLHQHFVAVHRWVH